MAHRNARLTVCGRLLLCRRIEEEGWLVKAAAQAAGISRQTASKWRRRLRLEGMTGLADRSSARRRPPDRIGGQLLRRVVRLRLRLRVGPHWLSWLTGAPRSSVYAVLRRLGLNRLRALEPKPQVVRYCWPAAGDLVHLDTKKLGRIGPAGGWRFAGRAAKDRHRGIGYNVVHVAVDDATRLAYAEELPDELGTTAAAFLDRALAFYAGQGIVVRRLLTDNGVSYRSQAFGAAVDSAGLRHLFTRPYRPQTNGKAEAFVKILQNGWAYRRPYQDGAQRLAALDRYLIYYNHFRPHGGLDGATPMQRLAL
jgi:transposase InsO family protein